MGCFASQKRRVSQAEAEAENLIFFRQDKKVILFQPAWLIRCSTQHQGQFPASSSRLHLRIWQPATCLAAT